QRPPVDDLLAQLAEAARPLRMGAAVLRFASVLAHRSTVLVPRTLYRPAPWELRSSASLRSSLKRARSRAGGAPAPRPGSTPHPRTPGTGGAGGRVGS